MQSNNKQKTRFIRRIFLVFWKILFVVLIIISPRLFLPKDFFIIETRRYVEPSNCPIKKVEQNEIKFSNQVTLLTISGGGSRAAFFSASVLIELERLARKQNSKLSKPSFLEKLV